MGLDFLELLFQMIGRGLCCGVRSITGRKCYLSDSGYEVVGLVLFLMFTIVSLLIFEEFTNFAIKHGVDSAAVNSIGRTTPSRHPVLRADCDGAEGVFAVAQLR